MPPSAESVQTALLARYTSDLQVLAQGNATSQAEAMQSARSGYEQAKAGPAALRYGLMLAAPGHPQRDAKLAQHVLQEAMAQPELLSMTERALGVVELARVDAELRLVTEKDRLIAALQQESEKLRAASANTASSKRQLQTEIEESARLRKALEEAKAKLDAITRMERNVPDRPPAPEGRNP
jgi:DNA polymerase I-like protein with 3'-5' exonuclease and polymerase domains